MSVADKETRKPAKGIQRAKGGRKPDWTSGLKQLYDSVLEEPLPDTFTDLLAKLDSEKK